MLKRYDQLDSLRGLAAMTVVLGHFFSVVNPSKFYTWLGHTPFAVIIAGHQAVILFFVLSGFVLSLPFIKKEIHIPSFIIKRICRIYIPYIVAIMIAIILWLLFSRNGISGMAKLDDFWTGPLDFKIIINHFLMTGSKQYKLDPVIWSLVHEMRISLVFPFILLFLVVKKNWRLSVLISVSLSLICLMLTFYFSSSSYVLSFAQTIHYTSMFIIGALLARHKDFLIDLLSKCSKRFKFSAAFIAWLLYTYANWFMQDVPFLHGRIFDDYVTTVGVCILIIISLSSTLVKKLLLLKPIHYLGKISYSLYLYHFVVMLLFINLFYGVMPIQLIWVISFTVTLIISTISYIYIELPSIKLGKALSKSLPYLFHSIMRKFNSRKGKYETTKFEYHHKKMKQYQEVE